MNTNGMNTNEQVNINNDTIFEASINKHINNMFTKDGHEVVYSWYAMILRIYSRMDSFHSTNINFGTVTKDDLLRLSDMFKKMADAMD